jgi:hypothetical protein
MDVQFGDQLADHVLQMPEKPDVGHIEDSAPKQDV